MKVVGVIGFILSVIVFLGLLHLSQIRQDRKLAAMEAAEEERVLLDRKVQQALRDGTMTPEDLEALGLDPGDFVRRPKYKIWKDADG